MRTFYLTQKLLTKLFQVPKCSPQLAMCFRLQKVNIQYLVSKKSFERCNSLLHECKSCMIRDSHAEINPSFVWALSLQRFLENHSRKSQSAYEIFRFAIVFCIQFNRQV